MCPTHSHDLQRLPVHLNVGHSLCFVVTYLQPSLGRAQAAPFENTGRGVVQRVEQYEGRGLEGQQQSLEMCVVS